MSDITYSNYNKKSLLVHGDRDKYGNKIKEVGGRWNPRVKGDPGWIVPLEKESDLKKLIARIKREEKIEVMGTHAKSNQEQKKYHRSVSESESESESEKESARKSEKDSSEEEKDSSEEEKEISRHVKPNIVNSPRRSEIINPISSRVKEEKNHKTREFESYEQSRKIRGIEKNSDKKRKNIVSDKRDHPENKRFETKIKSRRNYSSDSSPEQYPVSKRYPQYEEKKKSRIRRRKSPNLTDSESDYTSSEDDFPHPHSPMKRKSRRDLEQDMRRKIKDLERKVSELSIKKKDDHHRRKY